MDVNKLKTFMNSKGFELVSNKGFPVFKDVNDIECGFKDSYYRFFYNIDNIGKYHLRSTRVFDIKSFDNFYEEFKEIVMNLLWGGDDL